MTGSSRTFRRIQNRPGDRGAVIPMVAISLVVLIIGTAFSIDLGRQMSRRRDMQAIADVIALDMGRLIDGTSTRQALESSVAWEQQLTDTRSRNDFQPAGARQLEPVLGVWDEQSQTFTPSAPEGIPNAVRVTARDEVAYFFAPGAGGVNRLAIATKGGEETVDFSMGSYLATVSPFQGGVLGALIGTAFPGSSAFLDILSYRGLAAGNIDLGILATELGFATPNDLLDAGPITAADIFLASISALSCPDPPSQTNPCDSVAAINALNIIQQNPQAQIPIDLGEIAFIQQGGSEAVIDVQHLNALDVVAGTAQIINGENFISVPGLTTSIPGLATTTLGFQLINGPQPKRAFGVKAGPNCIPIDPQVDNPEANCLQVPQLVLSALTKFEPGAVTDLLLLDDCPARPPTKPLPGCGINIGIKLANAAAHPIDIECGAQQSTTINLDASVGEVVVSIDLNASVIGLVGASIGVDLPVVLAPSTGVTSTYQYTSDFLPPVGVGIERPLGSSELGLAGVTPFVIDQFDINLLGTPLGLGGVLQGLATTAFSSLITPILAQLDQTIVRELVQSLGLSLGGGYVGAIDMDCDAGGFLKLVK
ncbi:MAG: TadG family pilus assembly protein [Acidimicrobiia bacterium]